MATDLAPGVVLSGRYRLEERLGTGATASVWRARDLDLGRSVAVKALLGDDVDPELARRFEREGQILARLTHRNLVPVYATGEHDGRQYLVMELVDGLSLHEVLRDGPVPVDDAVSLVADVAAGLAAAHHAGIVHRDVKPANILCGTDGTPRLVDFGIARAEDITSVTRADVVIGTANYLSPEQARGDVPGPPSDVYALGCVLQELLTGRPPFAADSPVATAYRHVHDDPDPLGPDVPAGVAAVVARCLEKEPALRYATAADLEHDLRRVAAGDAPLPVETTMVLPPVEVVGTGEVIDPAPLVETRHRPVWPIVAAVAAVAVVLVLGALGLAGDGDPPSADADPTTTSTVVTTTTTTIPLPPPLPADDDDGDDDGGGAKGKGRGKKDD